MAIKVISNSSRYFRSFEESLSQPIAQLELTQFNFGKNHSISNSLYDSSLIKWDDNYCTDNPNHHNESLRNIETLLRELLTGREFCLVDIGCGQGELVKNLQAQGVDAWGFDPCLRAEGHQLHQRLFIPKTELQVLKLRKRAIPVFTMRCVLPHIKTYDVFLRELFDNFPTAKVYVEYHSLERMIQNHSWFMFMHDHCNYFTKQSFNDWNILAAGRFNEWDYVLLTAHEEKTQTIKFGRIKNKSNNVSSSDLIKACNGVLQLKQQTLESVAKLTTNGKLCIYSAAGKGANFGFAATQSNLFDEIYAVDLSKFKTGSYLESSGIRVYNARDLEKKCYELDTVIVLNKTHLETVKALGFKKIQLYQEIVRSYCVK